MNIKILGRRALIGRGFVGSNLNKEGRFTNWYHSQNIHEMSGHYDLIVCAAPSAEKWLVNRNPDVDLDNIQKLINRFSVTTADKMVLISTIDAEGDYPYGVNRAYLEREVLKHFRNSSVLRLGAVFGPGLKKNVLYDLLTRNEHHWCGNCAGVCAHPDDQYQWFNIEVLWDFIVNSIYGITRLYSKPIKVKEITERFFGDVYLWAPTITKRYDEETDCPYLSKELILMQMGEFIKQWRKDHA